MSVPGSNILSDALTVISSYTVTYYKYLSRSTNAIGVNISQYAAPVQILGSLQPIPRSLYQTLGLNFEKTYYTFYTSVDVLDLTRNYNGDQLVINGQQYHCESSNDWFAIDDWVGIICILVGNFNAETFGFESVNKNFDNGTFNV